jgi:hypothetical protein
MIALPNWLDEFLSSRGGGEGGGFIFLSVNRFSSQKINKNKIKLVALCLCVCLSWFKETGGTSQCPKVTGTH